LPETWRLLDYSSADPKMNWAINEAIFRSRREGLTKNTLRLWQSPKSVVLGGAASYGHDADHEACQKYGVEIIRAASVSSEVLYQDMGSLNFTIAADVAPFKNLIENYKPILSEYQILNEGVAKGLQRFDVDLKADPSGIYVDQRRISEALPYWFQDLLLFQGMLYIDTDLDVYNEVIRTKRYHEKKDALTTLTRELGKKIQVDEAKKALVQGVEERLGVRFEAQAVTEDEQKLIEKLHRVKYSSSEWNVKAHEPFLIGMGKIPVEIYVANPPTSMCRELISLVNDVVSDLQEEIKVMIWMRGRGMFQHGPYPEMSKALVAADKESRIPVIIINGQLKFSKAIPSKEDLRKTLLACIHSP
jgi:lipoate-protein ligase A